MAQNPQLLKIIAQQGQMEADSADAAITVMQQMDAMTGSFEDQKIAVKALTEARVAQTNEEQLLKAKVDREKALHKEELGLDPEKASYRFGELQREHKENYDKAQQIADVIGKKSQATLLTDPLTWINAQFTLPTDHKAYEMYAMKANTSDAELGRIVDVGTAAGKMTESLAATTSAALTSALASQKISEGNIELAKIGKDQAQFNINAATVVGAMQQKDLSGMLTVLNAQGSEERLKLAREQMSLTVISKENALEEQKARRQSRAEKEADDAYRVGLVNLGSRDIGGRDYSPDEVRRELANPSSKLSLLRARGQLIAERGGNVDIPISNIPNNPAAAIEVVRALGAKPIGPASDVISAISSEVDKQAVSVGITSLRDKDARLAALGQVVRKTFDDKAAGIQDNDLTNPYAAVTPKQLADMIPSFATQNDFVARVLLPYAEKNPTAPVTNAQILAMAKEDLGKNSSPGRVNQLSKDLTAYFNGAIEINNRFKKFGEYGLAPQVGFNAVLKEGVLGRAQTIDLSKEVNIKSLLMSAKVRLDRVTGILTDGGVQDTPAFYDR